MMRLMQSFSVLSGLNKFIISRRGGLQMIVFLEITHTKILNYFMAIHVPDDTQETIIISFCSFLKNGTGNIGLLAFNGVYEIISLKDVPVFGKKQTNNFSSF